jgi:epoxyqueuosine reductase QueG
VDAFQKAYCYPELVPVAQSPRIASPNEWTEAMNRFAIEHEADAVGVAPMDPLYVFEGYTIEEPWVIVLALAHNYERLKEVPSDETDGVGVCDVGDQYARGTRASYALANWIRSQGYKADPYPGPMASALTLIPPAIAAGLGELGKHGSLISRQFGSGLRLAGVTTDMPLVPSTRDRFGADEFCATCQICTQACPPGAITPQKQMVRGVERWYVDFDKCIPFFAEAASCGICIAECPWTRPTVRPKLLDTMKKRLEAQDPAESR